MISALPFPLGLGSTCLRPLVFSNGTFLWCLEKPSKLTEKKLRSSLKKKTQKQQVMLDLKLLKLQENIIISIETVSGVCVCVWVGEGEGEGEGGWKRVNRLVSYFFLCVCFCFRQTRVTVHVFCKLSHSVLHLFEVS